MLVSSICKLWFYEVLWDKKIIPRPQIFLTMVLFFNVEKSSKERWWRGTLQKRARLIGEKLSCLWLLLIQLALPLSRPGHQHWLKISWPSKYQPDWAILKHETFLHLADLRKKLPFLVLDNWKVVTNFLVKVVTQVLLFSGVTAFESLSADFKSMLMPRSGAVPLWRWKFC